MSKKKLWYFQDGATFYCYDSPIDGEGNETIVTAPMKVPDMDCGAAELAEKWFVEEHCPANNINPERYEV